MREKYKAMGNEMIRSLGFENKKVILFWKAFEEERWLACELHYNCFNKGLIKQSTLGIIIIVNEREVINMTVKELRAVLKLAVDENAEIQFSTEPGVAFGIHGFDNSEEEFWILLNTIEWENRVDNQSTLWYNDYSK